MQNIQNLYNKRRRGIYEYNTLSITWNLIYIFNDYFRKCVGFFFKDEIKDFYQQLFLGFAAGIMIAASVWSLLIPSMEMAEANGQNSALILGGGFIIGALFLLF